MQCAVLNVKLEHKNVSQILTLLYFFFLSNVQPNGVIPHDNLVLIKMKPDENGRFGFNVKVKCTAFVIYCTLQKLKILPSIFF